MNYKLLISFHHSYSMAFGFHFFFLFFSCSGSPSVRR